jgi:hypothetical protein
VGSRRPRRRSDDISHALKIWTDCQQTVQPRLQMSASTSQDPVITASGAWNGSGHRILGEGSPEVKAEPKSMILTLQLLESPGDRGSVDGSTRYCGRWLPTFVPRTSAVTGAPIDRSVSSIGLFEMVWSTSTILPGCKSKAHGLSRLDDTSSMTEQTSVYYTHAMDIRNRLHNLSAHLPRHTSRQAVSRI